MNVLSNKKFLITGASSGLGLNLTLQLLDNGAFVTAVARNQQQLDRSLPQHARLLKISADISNKADIYNIQAQAQTFMGDVDVLINNASFLGATPLRLLADTDCEDLERTLQTNLVGPFRLTKAVLGGMLLRKSGIVINISSDAAVNAYPRWGAYSASKAASDHLTRIFAAELGDQGLEFYAIDPGDMATPMHFAAIPDANPKDLKKPETAAAEMLQFLTRRLQSKTSMQNEARLSLSSLKKENIL